MAEPVQLEVRSALSKIIAELETLRDKAADVSSSLKDAGKDVGKEFNNNVKQTEGFLSNLRSFGRRVADQLRGDFRSLASLNAIGDSLKLSNQFRGSIQETVNLSDTIRKLGRTFGIATQDFSKFQSSMVKGLGEVGLSSEVAARAMEGLVETPVRGEQNILQYSKAAGQLASVAREQGKEGTIASGISRVIQARGGDVNDMKQMQAVAEDLRKIFNATGKLPTESLKVMEDIFTHMSKDFRQKFSTAGLANLATAAHVGGPGATKFLEEYLGKSPIARQAFEAQGGKGIFTEKGIDVGKFKKFSQEIMTRVGGDPRLAAQTLGLSEEAAEGFVRLAENLDKVNHAQKEIAHSTGDLNSQYKSSMGLGEAFRANINRVKRVLAEPLSFLTQKGTDLLSGAAGSDTGSLGVVAGGGALAALLAGFGLRGIGKGLGGGLGALGKGALAEQITGQKTVPVYVTNAAEIGLAGSGGGALGKAGGLLGKVGGGAAALTGGIAAGVAAADAYQDYVKANPETTVGQLDAKFTELIRVLSQKVGVIPETVGAQQKVIVELNKRDLKESRQPTRGASY